MARQRRLRPARKVDAESSPDIEAAIRRMLGRFVARKLSSRCTDKIAVQMCRELAEVGEMLVRVRNNIVMNGRGWPFNLMHVLEWDGKQISENERRVRPKIRAQFKDPLSCWLTKHLPEESAGPANEAMQRAHDREHEARGKRLREFVRAYSAVQRDLEWAMRRSGRLASDFAAANVCMADLIDRAIEDHNSVEAGLRSIGAIHGKVRRVEHVKVAAMLVLAELLGLDGPAALARAIEEAHTDASGPCPEFALVASDEHIRKMWNRCGLTSMSRRQTA